MQKSKFELNSSYNFSQNGFYCFDKSCPSKYLTRKGLYGDCTYGWFQDFQEFVKCFNQYSGETLMEIKNGELWTVKNIVKCKACGQEITNDKNEDGNKG